MTSKTTPCVGPLGSAKTFDHHRFNTSSRTPKLLSWILAATLCATSFGAQEANPWPTPAPENAATLLDEVVVTPTRTDETAAQVTSAYTKIDEQQLKRSQIPTVKQAVNLAPGITSREQGAEGATTAISIRGNRSIDTLILVDGMKADSVMFGNGGSPLLSAASAYNVQDIEVVRGPHSSLFGAEAIGGIVSLETRRGQGAPSSTLFFEGGSFNSFKEGLISGGSLGALDYSLHYAHEEASNDRENNDLRVNSGSLRLDYRASKNLVFGISTRVQNSDYQEPGSVRPVDAPWNVPYNDPNASTQQEVAIISAYAELKATDIWISKLTLGTYRERYVYDNPFDPESYVGRATPAYWMGDSFVLTPDFSNTQELTIMKSENWLADWKNTIDLSVRNRLVVGTGLLHQKGRNDYRNSMIDPYSASDLNQSSHGSSTDFGVYAEDQWEIIDNLTLAGSLRYDHIELGGKSSSVSTFSPQSKSPYDINADVLTYRLGAAYLVQSTRTKFRASIGTAFKEPTLWQLSTQQNAQGEILKPERSTSWDAGFDQYFLGDRFLIGASFFQSRINNLIAYIAQPLGQPAYYMNAHEARIHGIETALTAKLNDRWQARVAYTWTESEQSSLCWTSPDQIELGGLQRVPRVPRHIVSADTNYTFDLPVGWLTLGAGLFVAADRKDNDWAYGKTVIVNGRYDWAAKLDSVEDYVTARVYGRYNLSERAAFSVRVENLTNTHYEIVHGYPALGRGIYGGVEFTF